MISAIRQLRTPRRAVVVIGMLVALGLGIVFLPELVALAVPGVFGVLVLLVLVRCLIRWPEEDERRRVLRWTMLAFGAHLLFGLASTYISTNIRFYLGADSFSYESISKALLQHWTMHTPMPLVPHGKEGFYYLLASLFWLVGPHLSAGLAINATFAAGLVPVMSDLTDRLFGRAAARYAPALVVLMPGLFLWTSQLMKEASTLFLLAVTISCAVRLAERVSLGVLAVLTVSLVLSFTFRAWVALVVAAGLAIGLTLGRERLMSGLSTGISAISIVAALMLASGLGYEGYQAAVGSNLQQANAVRKDLATSANTGYAPDVDISSTHQAITYLPKGIVAYVAGPFPWQLGSIRELPFAPDMLVWWLLLPSLWRGYWQSKKLIGGRRLVLALPALGTILMLSLVLGNFGTVVRERLQTFIIVVPFIAVGLAMRQARRAGTPDVTEEEPEPVVAGLLQPQM
jgi:hypothetical protein